MIPGPKNVLERMDMTRAELDQDGLVGAAEDVALGMDMIKRLLTLLCTRAPHTFERELMTPEQIAEIDAFDRDSNFVEMVKLRQATLAEITNQ